MNRICIPTMVGGSMILVSLVLVIVSVITFSPVSVESLRITMFLTILVWGFGCVGLFIFGYGGLIFCRQREENEHD